jgi:fatty-acyl-CoA synthase
VLVRRRSTAAGPGEDELGWLAKSGRLASGYLGDPDKTARTVPDRRRRALRRARRSGQLRADGQIELHGRDSVTINSGGEKVFAEEVEAALKDHPAVYDCVVAGRPSERWGSEVVAVVQLREGARVSAADLRAAAGEHLARYKLPKAFVFVPAVVRSPSGQGRLPLGAGDGRAGLISRPAPSRPQRWRRPPRRRR